MVLNFNDNSYIDVDKIVMLIPSTDKETGMVVFDGVSVIIDAKQYNRIEKAYRKLRNDVMYDIELKKIR